LRIIGTSIGHGTLIRQNIKISTKENISHCESKHQKPWFDEERSKLVDQRKQVKLQWCVPIIFIDAIQNYFIVFHGEL
jgi:hypothetical protein